LRWEKYPVKVHVWAGINLHGPHKICIFEEIKSAFLKVTWMPLSLLKYLRVDNEDTYHVLMKVKIPLNAHSTLKGTYVCLYIFCNFVFQIIITVMDKQAQKIVATANQIIFFTCEVRMKVKIN